MDDLDTCLRCVEDGEGVAVAAAAAACCCDCSAPIFSWGVKFCVKRCVNVMCEVCVCEVSGIGGL